MIFCLFVCFFYFAAVFVSICKHFRFRWSATEHDRFIGFCCLPRTHSDDYNGCYFNKWLFYSIFFIFSVSVTKIAVKFFDFNHLSPDFSTLIIYWTETWTFCSRDRGYTNTTYPPIEPPYELSTPHEVSVYYGETIFVYGVSTVLHFCGFLAAMYVIRIADNEQLQNLVERVFILHNVPNKLIYTLWMQIAYGFMWLFTMTLYLIVMKDDNIDVAKIVWFGKPTEKTHIVAKMLLIATTFGQDIIQVIVLTSYSLQCYLLRRYVYILKGKLLQNTIDSLDWMRVSAL